MPEFTPAVSTHSPYLETANPRGSAIGDVPAREVVRCHGCQLVQFRTLSGMCRRCYRPLQLPQPESQAAEKIRSEYHTEAPLSTGEHGMGAATELHGKTMKEFQLGARLRELRERNYMTQAEVAVRAHVPRTYVSRIEHAHLLPGLSVSQRIADALGVELLDLIPNPSEPEAPVSSNDYYWNAFLRYFRLLREDDQSAVVSRVRSMLPNTRAGATLNFQPVRVAPAAPHASSLL